VFHSIAECLAQPSGAVTLVFTEVERSTRLPGGLGCDAYRPGVERRGSVRGGPDYAQSSASLADVRSAANTLPFCSCRSRAF
jgi:hypothetical protein